jgi:hypothetical protein
LRHLLPQTKDPWKPAGLQGSFVVGSVLESVLDVLAGLLEVGRGLVRAALGLEALVTLPLADRFLDLPHDTLAGVLDLVSGAHGSPPNVGNGFPGATLRRSGNPTVPCRPKIRISG